MRKKGFTLIELLAVIIVLAVIALIATPAVINVMEDAQDKANRQSVNGLIDAARNYYAESLLDENKKENVENVANIYGLVSITGEKPETGYLAVNNQNQVAVSVTMDKKCYIKHFASGLQEYEITDEKCSSFVGVDYESPEITFEINGVLGNNNWYKHNEESEDQKVKVTIKVEDSKSGVKSYKYCEGKSCEPSIEVTTSGQIVEISDTEGTKVCVQAIDNNGNISEACSEEIKVDTVLPSFSGISDMVVELNATVDLEEGVMVDEGLLEYTYTPEKVDTTTEGTKEVIYIAVDEAGNEKTVTRKINVANAPTVTFTEAEGTINENGWAKSDFYVTINVLDNSGNGIKSFNICTATTDTCEPSVGSEITGSTTSTRLISTENNNNRICVQAIDNNNLISPVICSDAYKLDKKEPEAGTILVNGTVPSTNWYNTDVTIEVVNGSDTLSGHLETTSNITSIKESTEGTVVTVTTKDVAGNVSTREYTIKVDKTLPEVTITEPTIDGENGWYVSKPTIIANVSDTYSTFSSLKWCLGSNCEPTEEIAVSSKSVEISDTEGTQLCVIGIDKAGNESEKKCSNVIKVDTVLPSFSGISDIVTTLNGTVNLENGATASDTTSKIDGTYTYNPTSVDTTKAGVTNVTYSVKDKAGNEKTVTRKVTVSTTAPTITYTAAEGAINESGWSKSDFYVTINVKDNSGHGIKTFNVCTATTDTCDPSTGSVVTGSITSTRLISTENSNNRICVQATDNYNQTSEVICSDAYKLDKTLPVAGTIKVNGSSTIKDWYGTDVTIEAVNGSDALSDHASTTVNTTSITSNTTGTTVTVTTTDLAGNSATRNYTIKVDKTQPTCTFSTLSYVGVNKTATIELTCTNTISGMNDKTLTTSDFTTSNSNISITGVSKTSVTNGYKYTLTVKGVTAGSSTITLPASKVSTIAGLSNAAKTSGTITVTSVSVDSLGSSYLYIGGVSRTATISGTNAGTYSCTSNNTSYATCSVSGNTLTVTPGNKEGVALFTITESNGGATVETGATVLLPEITLDTTSGTTTISGSNLTSTISGHNYGTLSCTSSSTSIAKCSISGTTLTITPVAAGTATITVTGSNTTLATATYTATIEDNSICRRATTLHTETCNPYLSSVSSGSEFCIGEGYTIGSTITYGNLGTSGTLNPGDAFDCDVNGDGIYDATTERFYYVSDIYDNSSNTFNENYAALIYYNNTYDGEPTLGSASKYNSSGDASSGPTSAKYDLPTTIQWTKVKLYNNNRKIKYYGGSTTFDYSGYAARLLDRNELEKFITNSMSTGSLKNYNYLMENTGYANSGGLAGYWLETGYYSYDYRMVLTIDATSRTMNYAYSDESYHYGVRPVIEVNKTDIAY